MAPHRTITPKAISVIARNPMESTTPQYSGVPTGGGSALITPPSKFVPTSGWPGVPSVAMAVAKLPVENAVGNPKYLATLWLMVPETLPNTASMTNPRGTIWTLWKSSATRTTLLKPVQTAAVTPAIQPVMFSVPGLPVPQLQVEDVPLKAPLVKFSNPSKTDNELPFLTEVLSPSTLRVGILVPVKSVFPPAQE